MKHDEMRQALYEDTEIDTQASFAINKQKPHDFIS